MSLFHRPPDLIVGNTDNPYLYRWHLIPRNRWLNVYVHKFVRSDDDRALHDHPWWSMSLILKGRYINHTPTGQTLRCRFSCMFMRATDRHRVVLLDDNPVWTLFITGRKVRDWGFWCPQGFVPWQQYVEQTDEDGVHRHIDGKGCN